MKPSVFPPVSLLWGGGGSSRFTPKPDIPRRIIKYVSWEDYASTLHTAELRRKDQQFESIYELTQVLAGIDLIVLHTVTGRWNAH